LIPQEIIGGFAFAREHHPTVIKFAFLLTCVPTSTTGIGIKMFGVTGILSMEWCSGFL
jgi:hypothetical protein